MTQSHGTSTGVELLQGNIQSSLTGNCLRGEGFIDLDLVDLSQGDASLLHHGLDGGDGANAHDGWLTAGNSVANNPGEGGEGVLGDGVLAGDDDCCCPVKTSKLFPPRSTDVRSPVTNTGG